ncbi:MAG: lamin tail domain-containing protein [Leptospira sp.]|nr:lamin tail domain-containing protein [Leptospira sp.]
MLLDQFSGNALDEILYDPGRGNGISSSSPKLRRSYSYTGFLNIWKNSRGNKGHIFTLPSCSVETNQSPGEDNDFEPGLFTDHGFNFPLAYNILSSVFQPDGNLGATQYSISPPFAFHFSIGLSLSDRFRLIFLSPDPVFTANSLVYQSIENSSDLKLFNRDGIFIQAISPNPSNSQNEWVMLCNRGNDPQDLSQYELEDSSSTDIFATYKERKGNDLPIGLEPVFFSGDISVLNPGQCAFIVDPDSDQLHLRQTGSGISPVLTVKNGSTIGNGLGTEESIDLFKYVNGERIHIHSYGNRYSHSPFSINAGKNEIIFLKPGKRGEEPADYESLLW